VILTNLSDCKCNQFSSFYLWSPSTFSLSSNIFYSTAYSFIYQCYIVNTHATEYISICFYKEGHSASNCNFINNSQDGEYGLIGVQSSTTMESCCFFANNLDSGTLFYVLDGSALTVQDSNIQQDYTYEGAFTSSSNHEIRTKHYYLYHRLSNQANDRNVVNCPVGLDIVFIKMCTCNVNRLRINKGIVMVIIGIKS
jgi:hypothetical protein